MKYLFYFVLSLILIGFGFHFLTKKYINPYTFTIIFGKKGCGKSTMLQKLARYYDKRGYKVYCNVGDSFESFVQPIPVKQCARLLGQYASNRSSDSWDDDDYRRFCHDNKIPYVQREAVILCDELNLIWDNRDFKNFDQNTAAYFRLQRHFKHKFIAFSQTYDCDKKLRDLADELLICRRILRIFIRTKAYFKKVVVVSPSSDNSRETAIMTDDFIPRGLLYDLIFSPFHAFLPRWVKHHNSFK